MDKKVVFLLNPFVSPMLAAAFFVFFYLSGNSLSPYFLRMAGVKCSGLSACHLGILSASISSYLKFFTLVLVSLKSYFIV